MKLLLFQVHLYLIYVRIMKKGEFSYEMGRSQSHASLTRMRRNTEDSRNDSLQRQSTQRPNVKFFAINHDDNPKNNNKPLKKTTHFANRINENSQGYASKSDQQIRKQNKLLQYELKKKLNQHTILCKFFRTKNNSELSHIDIYLQMSKMQDELEQYKEKQKQSEQKIEECSKQLQDLLLEKENDEMEHLKIIEETNARVEKMKEKYKEEIISITNNYEREKKRHQETRVLLGEIRKKYEQVKADRQHIHEQIEKEKEIKNKGKEEQRKQQKKLQTEINRKNDEIDNLRNQIEKYKVREKENQLIMQEMKKHYEDIRLTQEKTLSEEKSYKFTQNREIDSLKATVTDLQHTIHEISTELHQQKLKSQNYHHKILSLQEQVQHTEKQKIQQQKVFQHKIKQYDTLKSKLHKEISTLSEKILQFQSKNKMLIFQINEKESILQGTMKKMTETENIKEELQQKVYVLEKNAKVYTEKIKELQKIGQAFEECKISQYKSSKNEIQNYMAIGRLMELIHQFKSLLNIEVTNSPDFRNVENQNLSEYISNLAQLLDAFLKTEYQPALQQNKIYREEISQLQNDLKSILYAYNNFVQEEELLGHSRQYLQAVLSEDRSHSNKKLRNESLQAIFEKLISMTAIKSYASDQGSQGRKQQFQTRQSSISRHRNRDSLENTLNSKYIEPEINQLYYHRIPNNSNSKQSRQRRDPEYRQRQRQRQNQRDCLRKLIKTKLETEPSEPKTKDLIRKLNYPSHYKQDDHYNKQNRNRQNLIGNFHNSRSKNNNDKISMQDVQKKYYR